MKKDLWKYNFKKDWENYKIMWIKVELFMYNKLWEIV